jgi:hypothetical protein
MINFDHHGGGFAVHVLSEDAKTPISGWTNVESESALIKLLAYYGCVDIKEASASLRHWAGAAPGASQTRLIPLTGYSTPISLEKPSFVTASAGLRRIAFRSSTGGATMRLSIGRSPT